jgi:hypothetical protein
MWAFCSSFALWWYGLYGRKIRITAWGIPLTNRRQMSKYTQLALIEVYDDHQENITL